MIDDWHERHPVIKFSCRPTNATPLASMRFVCNSVSFLLCSDRYLSHLLPIGVKGRSVIWTDLFPFWWCPNARPEKKEGSALGPLKSHLTANISKTVSYMSIAWHQFDERKSQGGYVAPRPRGVHYKQRYVAFFEHFCNTFYDKRETTDGWPCNASVDSCLSR